MNKIVDLLFPITVEATLWNLKEAEAFARGLALERQGMSEALDERCTVCGYALEGLAVLSCPGCGRQLKH